VGRREGRTKRMGRIGRGGRRGKRKGEKEGKGKEGGEGREWRGSRPTVIFKSRRLCPLLHTQTAGKGRAIL